MNAIFLAILLLVIIPAASALTISLPAAVHLLSKATAHTNSLFRPGKLLGFTINKYDLLPAFSLLLTNYIYISIKLLGIYSFSVESIIFAPILIVLFVNTLEIPRIIMFNNLAAVKWCQIITSVAIPLAYSLLILSDPKIAIT